MRRTLNAAFGSKQATERGNRRDNARITDQNPRAGSYQGRGGRELSGSSRGPLVADTPAKRTGLRPIRMSRWSLTKGVVGGDSPARVTRGLASDLRRASARSAAATPEVPSGAL